MLNINMKNTQFSFKYLVDRNLLLLRLWAELEGTFFEFDVEADISSMI